jgi:hypothetical protein
VVLQRSGPGYSFQSVVAPLEIEVTLKNRRLIESLPTAVATDLRIFQDRRMDAFLYSPKSMQNLPRFSRQLVAKIIHNDAATAIATTKRLLP